MSRSFYVDSLIVKDSTNVGSDLMMTKCNSSSKSPQHASQAITLQQSRMGTPNHMPTLHPVPCYPRHHADVMNICCPLCVAPPSQLLPDHVSYVPATTLAVSLSSAITSSAFGLSRLHNGSRPSQEKVHALPDPGLPKHDTSPRRSPTETERSVIEQRRIRYGSIGK